MELRNILVATDFSESADQAVATARKLAAGFGARLHLIHVLEAPIPAFDPFAVTVAGHYFEDARASAQARLDAAQAEARGDGLDGTTDLGEMPAAPAIAERARTVGADLVVVGAHGHSALTRFLLGSVAEATVKLAPCSVLAVRQADEGPQPCIVVGTDFSETGARAVQAGFELARRLGTGVHLVHAMTLPTPWVSIYEVSVPTDLFESTFQRAKEELASIAGAQQLDGEVTTEVLAEAPHLALVQAAEKHRAQMVVTGSHGRTGAAHLLVGSVAERTLRHAPCSVWIAREPEASA